MRRILLLTLVLSTLAAAALEMNGMARHYTALRLKEDPDFAILQNTFKLSFHNKNDKGGFNVDLYAYQYGKDLSPELNLQQLYVDLYFSKFDLRLGRQQIIWGKADGVFITDVVSPKDLREFLLPDFAEIRQGIDAFTGTFYAGNHLFSLVLSPAFRPTIQPQKGSIWQPAMDFPPVKIKIDSASAEVPLTLQNSEAFFRWSAMLSAVDFELVGATMLDDDPALHLTKYAHPEGSRMMIDSILVSPRHHRIGMGGGSFSTTIKGIVAKGEAGYYTQKKFRSSNPQIRDGITKGDYLHYMAGLSYTLAGVDFQGQFIQKVLLDHDHFYLEKQFQNMMTVIVHKSLLRETLHLDLLSYIGLTNKDALIRPSVAYDIADGLKATVGANVFIGDSGYFGQFNANDMAYFKLSYSF